MFVYVPPDGVTDDEDINENLEKNIMKQILRPHMKYNQV